MQNPTTVIPFRTLAQQPRPAAAAGDTVRNLCERSSILMLQGHPSRFWGELADALTADGHRVVKVHFCLADRVFWGRRPAIAYRGRLSRFESWIGDLMRREGVTDVLYYADRLPYHVAARTAAERLGVAPWAVEHGYLRPDWLTLEPGGMGAHSSLPRDWAGLETLARGRPRPDMRPRFGHSFATEAVNEVAFNLLMVAGRPLWPFYRSDKVHWPVFDYLAWLPHLAAERRHQREAAALADELAQRKQPFTLVAMQMATDYQIRASSAYGHLSEFVAEVLASFARHAPADRLLVFKLHPLESGIERWFSVIARLADRAGVAGRVRVIRGGDLGGFLRLSQGVVMVNSTVGIHALRMGVPVCTRGAAVFDLPGLTHQGGLDRFWTTPEPVDPGRFQLFERAISAVQIKGSFFDPAGRAAAIAEFRQRLAARARPIRLEAMAPAAAQAPTELAQTEPAPAAAGHPLPAPASKGPRPGPGIPARATLKLRRRSRRPAGHQSSAPN